MCWGHWSSAYAKGVTNCISEKGLRGKAQEFIYLWERVFSTHHGSWEVETLPTETGILYPHWSQVTGILAGTELMAMTTLMGLQFKIIYRKGKDNVAADALLRIAHLSALQVVSLVKPDWVQEILNSYTSDARAQQLLTQLAVSSPNPSGYSLDNGLIRYHSKIWVGHNSALQTKFIHTFHSSAIGGHSGAKVTYQRLANHFAWKGMKNDVAEFIRQCQVCQQAKHTNSLPAGLLQPLPVPEGVWRDLSMDFVEGLPKSQGYNVIMVVMDRFTKFPHFIAVKHPYTAPTIAQLFMDNIVKLHGLPQSIITDRDTIFVSSFWKEHFKLYRVNLKLSTAYHPQTDGQTERVNQCLEMFLRCAVQDSPTTWKSWLSLAQLWYNSSYHTSIGCSPFKALYGYQPNVGATPTVPSSTSTSVSEVIENRELHM